MARRRGIIIVVSLIFIALFISFAGLIVIGLFFGGSPPAPVPANATLTLKINGPWDEVERLSLLNAFAEPPRTLRRTIDLIKAAKSDTRIKTLLIQPQSTGALWAQLQELRDALADFRTSGKQITAYLEYGGAQEYYLASVADRIVMLPTGGLELSGVATYELFLRGALDKIGVVPDLLHIGDYKSASNTFTEKGFTAAHREMTRWLNRDWYDQLVRGIAAGRKKTDAEIVRAVDGGPYLADAALKAGLIDSLLYEDQLEREAPIQGTQRFNANDYERAMPAEPSGSARIALLYATGEITSGASAGDAGSSATIGSDTFVQWVRKVRLDPTIKAVVVRIDSPGGSAIASDVIWRELMLTRDVKPLIVSMGDVAASGGYYIALPAHAIVAQPGTITGSIGVVTGKLVLKGTLDKLGIGAEAVSDGRNAEINSPLRPFTRDERARIDEQMQSTYDVFLAHVADARKSTPAKIDAVAQGKVWTGRQAREHGLVDELGGLETAIQLAKQRAKLDPLRGISLVVYPQKRGLLDLLMNPLGSSMDASLQLFTRPDARLLQSVATTMGRFRRGEPLTLMPNLFWR